MWVLDFGLMGSNMEIKPQSPPPPKKKKKKLNFNFVFTEVLLTTRHYKGLIQH